MTSQFTLSDDDSHIIAREILSEVYPLTVQFKTGFTS